MRPSPEINRPFPLIPKIIILNFYIPCSPNLPLFPRSLHFLDFFLMFPQNKWSCSHSPKPQEGPQYLFSLFLHKNTCCGYSEVPRWGISNKYPQHTLLWRMKANYSRTRKVNAQCLFYSPHKKRPRDDRLMDRQTDGHTDGQDENNIPPQSQLARDIIIIKYPSLTIPLFPDTYLF